MSKLKVSNPLSKVNWTTVVTKAAYTAAQTFIALQGAVPLIAWAGGSKPLDINGIRAAAVAGLAGGVTYVWHVVKQALAAAPAPTPPAA